MTVEASSGKKLVLVDAYSLLYRAFFAGRYLSTSDNRPTGALYGFTNMIFSLIAAEKPDALVVCWDGPERTIRRQQFEDYKAHRPEVDPQLKEQMPMARDVVEAFGIQSAELPGYEADDLIGTLAARGRGQGYLVTILTGDSDELQLVRDGIVVRMCQRGVSETRRYDAEAVRERYGIDPDMIPDWKGLVGDTSDNIPGVPGIGEKGATALLQRWGSLENLLEHIAEVTPVRLKTALENNVDLARLSRSLAEIVCDAPLDLEITPYEPTDDDWGRVRRKFEELEFRSLLTRIPAPLPPAIDAVEVLFDDGTATQPAAVPITVNLVDSPQMLADILAAAKRTGTLALLPSATAAPPMMARLRGLGLAASQSEAWYVPVRLQDDAPAGAFGGLFDSPEEGAGAEFRVDVEDLRALIEDTSISRVGHDVKFAEILLERAGLRPPPFVFDSMIAAYLLNAGRSAYPLTELAETYLGARVTVEAGGDQEVTAGTEAVVALRLVNVLREQLAATGMLEILDRVEMPLVPVLAAIEQAGVAIDAPYLLQLSARMGRDADTLAREIYEIAGEEFNIGSPKQLQAVLFDKLKLPTGGKTKTGYTTRADLLESLAPQYEIARKILDYREIAKLKTTYADALPKLVHPETGRIHTSLNQAVTSTGRLSSSDPNLQNIPIRSEAGREIRRAFVAEDRKLLLSCDYSQIELRVLAHVSKDPALLAAFAADEDIHAATASAVFNVPIAEVTANQRRQAKTINFAVIYGQTGYGLASTLGVEPSVASQWIEAYLNRLQGVKRYVEETTEQARRDGYVSTLLGRRRYVPEIQSGNHNIRQAAIRAAVNMPIQGTAADIMKVAMIEVAQFLRGNPACMLLLQVHDELLFEIEEALLPGLAPELARVMETAYPLDVRLRVDSKVGRSWSEMKPIPVQQPGIFAQE